MRHVTRVREFRILISQSWVKSGPGRQSVIIARKVKTSAQKKPPDFYKN